MVRYDQYGRLQYDPELHPKHCMPWTTSEQIYLIENYELQGPEAVSFALERTVMTRAYKLRKQGLMKKPSKRIVHRRMAQL